MSFLRNLLRGAAAGAVATGPHTLVMLGARRLGLVGKLPPKKITDALVDRIARDASYETRVVLTAVNHVAMGAASGAVFAAVKPKVSRKLATGLGMLFGLGVWFVSYEGWVPALGIMPPASKDYRFGRQAAMVVAHLAYGGVLGAMTART